MCGLKKKCVCVTNENLSCWTPKENAFVKVTYCTLSGTAEKKEIRLLGTFSFYREWIDNLSTIGVSLLCHTFVPKNNWSQRRNSCSRGLHGCEWMYLLCGLMLKIDSIRSGGGTKIWTILWTKNDNLYLELELRLSNVCKVIWRLGFFSCIYDWNR